MTDHVMDGMVYGSYSLKLPFAKVKSIDFTKAEAVDGVWNP